MWRSIVQALRDDDVDALHTEEYEKALLVAFQFFRWSPRTTAYLLARTKRGIKIPEDDGYRAPHVRRAQEDQAKFGSKRFSGFFILTDIPFDPEVHRMLYHSDPRYFLRTRPGDQDISMEILLFYQGLMTPRHFRRWTKANLKLFDEEASTWVYRNHPTFITPGALNNIMLRNIIPVLLPMCRDLLTTHKCQMILIEHFWTYPRRDELYHHLIGIPRDIRYTWLAIVLEMKDYDRLEGLEYTTNILHLLVSVNHPEYLKKIARSAKYVPSFYDRRLPKIKGLTWTDAHSDILKRYSANLTFDMTRLQYSIPVDHFTALILGLDEVQVKSLCERFPDKMLDLMYKHQEVIRPLCVSAFMVDREIQRDQYERMGIFVCGKRNLRLERKSTHQVLTKIKDFKDLEQVCLAYLSDPSVLEKEL